MLTVGCSPPEETASSRDPVTPSTTMPRVTVLARLGGEPITAGEFEVYLSRARPPGHRIATIQEATRLLQGLAEERLLRRELGASASGDHEGDGLWRAREVLVEERQGPVTIDAPEVDRYIARHHSVLAAAQAPSDLERERIAEMLRRRRIERLSRALLSERLRRSLAGVDFEALRAFVKGDGLAQGPPIPPGFPIPEAVTSRAARQ